MTQASPTGTKRRYTIFLQTVVVLIGVGAVALLLWEPQIEGVNAHATNFQIYTDPFILLVYAGSIPFFIALVSAFRILGYAGRSTIFSDAAVKGLRTIKYCAVAIIGFVAAEELMIFLHRSGDDRAGGVFMGVLFTFGSVVIATAAAMFERILQSAVEMKSENELTV